jgi:transglutaminase-like putative cysteine protease
MSLTTLAAALTLCLLPAPQDAGPAVGPAAGPAAGTQLLPNPGLSDGARGWILKGAGVREQAGPGQATAVALAGVDQPKSWTNLGVQLTDPPRGRALEFSVSLRGKTGHEVVVNAFAYGADDATAERWHQKLTLASTEWEQRRVTYVLPASAERFAIWVINSGKDEVLVARPSLTVGARAVPRDLSGPGIIRASANAAVRPAEPGGTGTVRFPIPLLTQTQVPLTFDVEVDPPAALVGYRWLLREDGVNWQCEVTLAPKGGGARVRWESLVLVGASSAAPLPSVRVPEAPEEAEAWLRATACVQSDDEAVVAKAAELARGTKTIDQLVDKVLAFTSTNAGTGVPLRTLDAANALGAGGSCTSRANLAAALLRARGVPARTSAHLPTWSGPLYEHWHVEYWHPGAGWTWIEPTRGELRPQPYSLVVLNVANPDDEDEAFSPVLAHSGVMQGVARHAVHELSEGLEVAGGGWGPDQDLMNVAVAAASLDGDVADAFDAARAAWKSLAAACREGKADPGRTASIEAALAEDDVARALVEALAP